METRTAMLRRLLEDGEWHSLGELIAALGHTIRPEVAWRRVGHGHCIADRVATGRKLKVSDALRYIGVQWRWSGENREVRISPDADSYSGLLVAGEEAVALTLEASKARQEERRR